MFVMYEENNTHKFYILSTLKGWIFSIIVEGGGGGAIFLVISSARGQHPKVNLLVTSEGPWVQLRSYETLVIWADR